MRRVLSSHFLRIFSSIMIFSLLSVNLFAQQDETKVIGKVVVKGTKKSNAETIRFYSKLITGKTVTAEDFAEAIKLLWNLNSFSSIAITTTNPTDKVINLAIEVEEYPQLESLAFTGNDEFDSGKLTTEVNISTRDLISPGKMISGKKKIKELYNDKGYLLANIEIDTTINADNGNLALTYNITEGEKVKIDKIYFEGNEAFTDGKLRKEFKKTKQDGLFRGGDFSKAEYENDKKLLIEFYNKNGFRDAEVQSDSIYYDDEKKNMYIVVMVKEGERYYFRNIEIDSTKEFSRERLKAALDINKGDVFNSEKFDKGIYQIVQAVNSRGYLLANINSPETPVGKDSVDVKISIDLGEPVTVNKVDIRGNTKTKDKVIRREVKIKPGQIYNQQLMERSFRDISMLNYFANVVPNVEPTQVEEKVNLVFDVEEKSTDTANMSAGYSERDGMLGSLGLTMNNLFGNGQRLSLDWQFGKIFRMFQIGFTEPYLMDTPTLAGFTVYDLKRGGQYYGYDQESVGATVRLGRLLKWPDNFFRGDLFLEYSKNRYSNFRDFSDPRAAFYRSAQSSDRVSLTQVITRDSHGPNPEYPTSGSRVSLSTQFAGGFLGGTEDYIKNIFKSEWYFSTFWKFTLYNSAEFGHIVSFNKENKYISLQELFYMGGSALSFGTMLRGYEERTVGPLSSNGTPQGGKTMVKFSTEYRFPLSTNPTIYGLLFAEAGNNWLEPSTIDPFNLRRSAGVGLRVFLPMIGMLGIDMGYGFDAFEAFGKTSGNWMPHFQFGRGF